MKLLQKTFSLMVLLFVSVSVISFTNFSAKASVDSYKETPTISSTYIYANGTPIIIVEGETEGLTSIYVDAGTIGEYDAADTVSVIENSDLSDYTILGGFNSEQTNVSTSITMFGGTVGNIYGGSRYGNMTGSTSIVINGGTTNNIYGATRSGTMTGDTSIVIKDGTTASIYGGTYNANMNGDVSILIEGGSILGALSDGSFSSSSSNRTTLTGNTSIVISGGDIIGAEYTTGSVYSGGGTYNTIIGNTSLSISDAEIKGNVYAFKTKLSDETPATNTFIVSGSPKIGGPNSHGVMTYYSNNYLQKEIHTDFELNGLTSGAEIYVMVSASTALVDDIIATNATESDAQYFEVNRSDYYDSPEMVFAAKYDSGDIVLEEIDAYPLYVGGVRVTERNKDNVLKDSSSTVKYTAATASAPAILTLNGANITDGIDDSYRQVTRGSSEVSDTVAAIWTKENLEIILIGDNTVTAPQREADYWGDPYHIVGIMADFNSHLTISGDGSLDVSASDIQDNDYWASARSAGIMGLSGITIESGTINATGGDGLYGDDNIDYYVEEYSVGIMSMGDLTINGGTVTATSGENVAYSYGIGVTAGGKLIINEGTVTATANSTNTSAAYALQVMPTYSSTTNASVTAGDDAGTASSVDLSTSTDYNTKKYVKIDAVKEILLSSIAVTQSPTTTTYKYGESLDTTGMIVTATYSDGSKNEITPTDITDISTFSVGDDQTVTVSYQDKTATFTVNIVKADQNPTITETTSLQVSTTKDLKTLLSGAKGDVSFSIGDSGTSTGASIDADGVFSAGTTAGIVKINVAISSTDTHNSYEETNAITITIQEAPIISYTITASSGQNGSIDPTGVVHVNENDTQTFTFTPDTGYQVATVTVDGSDVALSNSYTFNDVGENHTILVEFSPIKYTVSFDTDGADPVDEQILDFGAKVLKPLDPTKEGFNFEGWYKDSGFTTIWNFDTDTVSATTTLYAKWSEDAALPQVKDPVTSEGETEVEIAVKPTTSGNNSSADIPDSTVQEAVNEALSEVSGTDNAPKVTINLDVPENSTGIELTLNPSKLQALADSEDSVFEIKSDAGTMTFDFTALNAVVDSAQGDEIRLVLRKVEDINELSDEQTEFAQSDPVYELYIEANGRKITDFDGGIVTVTVSEDLALEDGAVVTVYFVDDNGNSEKRKTVYDSATRTISFDTGRFSHYVIKVSNETSSETTTPTTTPDSSTPDTGDHFNLSLSVSLMLISLIAVLTCRFLLKKYAD